MPFTNARRTTIDGYEFQEHVAGCWQYSHTDTGYYEMLTNKAAYNDNQALGGNPFRIIKRRIQKSDYTADGLKGLERADLKAKVEYLTKRIAKRPESKRNKSHKFWIEREQKRIKVLSNLSPCTL